MIFENLNIEPNILQISKTIEKLGKSGGNRFENQKCFENPNLKSAKNRSEICKMFGSRFKFSKIKKF